MSDPIITIESLDMEARGVGHLQNEDGTPGKVIFVEGALPGEVVSFSSFRRKAKWEAARMTALHKESALRVKPKCPWFGVCGGCAMQHIEPSAQVAAKQRVLEDNLAHIGRVKPEMMLRPIHGPTWEYRYRARMSIRYVAKKGGVLVGFHERASGFITDMTSCEVVPKNVSDMLPALRGLISQMSERDKFPQVELAVGEAGGERSTVLVLRNMVALTAHDEQLLREFGDRHGVQWWLQPKGPDTAYPFHPSQSKLAYELPEFGITMPFKPTDFTQVNHQINRVLVAKALGMLDPQPGERIADLFCGLGNFTLPLATKSAEVVGIEGSEALVARARENARFNGLENKTSFQARNLFEFKPEDLIALGRFDRFLVDPPRDGAAAVCETLAALSGTHPDLLPKRIVYVSCNPSTLARDAGTLVTQAGYRLKQAGVINMFPHTAHVESIALFERE